MKNTNTKIFLASRSCFGGVVLFKDINKAQTTDVGLAEGVTSFRLFYV